jgi:hypothetical protein
LLAVARSSAWLERGCKGLRSRMFSLIVLRLWSRPVGAPVVPLASVVLPKNLPSTLAACVEFGTLRIEYNKDECVCGALECTVLLPRWNGKPSPPTIAITTTETTQASISFSIQEDPSPRPPPPRPPPHGSTTTPTTAPIPRSGSIQHAPK